MEFKDVCEEMKTAYAPRLTVRLIATVRLDLYMKMVAAETLMNVKQKAHYELSVNHTFIIIKLDGFQ